MPTSRHFKPEGQDRYLECSGLQTQILSGRVAKTRTQQVRPRRSSMQRQYLGKFSFRKPDLGPRARAQETVLAVQLGLILSKL